MSIVQEQVLEPYAQALISLAQTHDLTEEIGENMRSVLNLIQESEELQSLLANPCIKAEAKKSIVDQIVGEQVHPYTRNFLKLLVDRRRILFLEGICQQYLAILRKLNKTVLAEVTSAVELNGDQQQAVKDRVKAMTNANQVDLEVKLNDELIGGVIIKVGSQVIDASLRGQLRRIGMRLSSAT
jgi:F-type H+-transporting ATPase subunit delta